jgi:hypothetical protein
VYETSGEIKNAYFAQPVIQQTQSYKYPHPFRHFYAPPNVIPLLAGSINISTIVFRDSIRARQRSGFDLPSVCREGESGDK